MTLKELSVDEFHTHGCSVVDVLRLQKCRPYVVNSVKLRGF